MVYVQIILSFIKIMIKNVCFIHVATVGNYQEIFNQILNYFEESNIYDELDSVYVNIAGDKNIYIPRITKMKIIAQRANLTDFEFSTMNLIRNYSLENSGNVLYLHLKGVTASDNLCIKDHRDYMFYFNILKFKMCLNFLKEYDAVGVDLSNEPTKHFSGNIWWSKTQHINTLINPKHLPLILTERHKCEFWICSNKDGKYKSLHQSNINVYERHLHRYPLEKYKIDINL